MMAAGRGGSAGQIDWACSIIACPFGSDHYRRGQCPANPEDGDSVVEPMQLTVKAAGRRSSNRVAPEIE
jgi:hypothetical protein